MNLETEIAVLNARIEEKEKMIESLNKIIDKLTEHSNDFFGYIQSNTYPTGGVIHTSSLPSQYYSVSGSALDYSTFSSSTTY